MKKNNKLFLSLARTFLILSMSIAIISCKSDTKEKPEQPGKTDIEEGSKSKSKSSNEVISIITNAMEFNTKERWKSGWKTIKYKNNSNETHFILFDKYPEGKNLEDTKKEIVPPFQEGMDFINAGEFEKVGEAFGKLPEWFQEVEYKGGVGLISAKSTAQSTIYLDPGTYIIECYVKMANGVFHSTEGMNKQIEVTKADSSKLDIKADYVINIDVNNGIVFNEMVSAGEKTFKVKFGEQKVHENYVMSDVHLVWIDEGADISKLNSWMNWADPKGLQTPSPEGFKFLGGMQEMNQGGTGYFTVNIRSGNYALIAEVPDPQSKGLLKTFTVK
ncbi:secreted protein [Christiangramia forsetii KT0803]|uniref:Secreted protein n=2 Tax=Christiangramia forsetii TaxID=411153 RepID=A0M5P7_CHRFK|nr:secreted protein [Christiangramia forsetii KT0803]